ncbi:MAG TPA: hypothetical protein VFB38_20185 [Chthonomonadaceae bacterium]|nr:hypothetical protein [Chthonomonadaceae bacterium]
MGEKDNKTQGSAVEAVSTGNQANRKRAQSEVAQDAGLDLPRAEPQVPDTAEILPIGKYGSGAPEEPEADASQIKPDRD